MARVQCWQVDAFSDRPFHGNPAAICWLEQAADPKWMQSVAAEMNLSETAFVRPITDGLELRWFTPIVEVDLCGHATLAAAHAVWAANRADGNQPILFHTKSGVLSCRRDGDFIELDFPSTPAAPMEIPAALLEGLGAKPVFVGMSKYYVLAELESAAAVRSLRPDCRRLADVMALGVIVTAPSDDPKFDFISRFFAPNLGVDEDPVCGSAHCVLTPYWSNKLGKTSLMAFQASARGGILRLRHEGNRVILGGKAVTVWQGELLQGPPV